jgi:hypothetical protein
MKLVAVFVLSMIIGFYIGAIYSSPLIIRETHTETTTITTTTRIAPTPRVYIAKLYPHDINYILEWELIGDGPMDAELYYALRVKPPPAGYKYFIFSNISPRYLDNPILGQAGLMCEEALLCDQGGEGCWWDTLCYIVPFQRYNSTHIYAFTNQSCISLVFVVRYYKWEEDTVRNSYISIVVVEEGAKPEEIVANFL